MNALFDFLSGKRKDSRGRYFAEILALDDAALEAGHDYIQWLFPLREASAFNRGAPVLSGSDAAALRLSPEIQSNLLKALARMRSFYGYPALEGQTWLRRHNHNYLRLTRILKCLKLAGLDKEAEEFYAWLTQLYGRHATVIGEETFAFWTAAIRG